MQHRFQTILAAISRGLTQHSSRPGTDQLAALTDDHHRSLSRRWWRWRQCFLELKRLQHEARRGR